MSDNAIKTLPRPLSASLLNDWERCRRKFELKALQQRRWPSPPSNNFELGTSVHKLMEFEARGLPLARLLSGSSRQNIAQYWTLLAQHPMAQWPVIASEWRFVLPVFDESGRLLSRIEGQIDRIAQDPNGTLWVLDWKTGTRPPRAPAEDWQTIIYLLAATDAAIELLGHALPPEQVCFAYLHAQAHDVVVTTLPHHPQQHALYHTRLRQTVAAICTTATPFTLPPACPDAYCPYRAICGIEKVAPVGNGRVAAGGAKV
jgi:hypothetical protein